MLHKAFFRNFKLFIGYALVVIERLIPKKRGSVCFSMTPGLYNGNSKSLFEHIITQPYGKLDAFWLYDHLLDVRSVQPSASKKMFRRYSVIGGWRFLRADIIVLSHGFGDMGAYAKSSKRKKVLQLWHGIGIKSMGIFDENFDSKMIERFMQKETRYYNYVVVSSDVDRYYSASYMGIDARKVVVTGLPRNDVLANFDKKIKDDKFKTLYAPTFRDKPHDLDNLFFPFSMNYEVAVEWAYANDIIFLLRPHPNDKDSFQALKRLEDLNPDVFKDASNQAVPDCMTLLKECDGVVTDYSSVYIDGLLRNLPCVFVDFDREEYLKKRGLAYEYELITPGPKVQNWADFKTACESMTLGAEEWAQNREFVRKMFFKYRDPNACARVAAVIDEMLEE